jgi:hypothetical protein
LFNLKNKTCVVPVKEMNTNFSFSAHLVKYLCQKFIPAFKIDYKSYKLLVPVVLDCNVT